MNELQIRQALLPQGEILSLKYSGIGWITISLFQQSTGLQK